MFKSTDIHHNKKVSNSIFDKGIIDCIEIEYLKLVAISVKDKTLVLWDFINN